MEKEPRVMFHGVFIIFQEVMKLQSLERLAGINVFLKNVHKKKFVASYSQ